MSKVLVVFGATGQQGKSVVNVVQNDPELSKEYSIRAVTRNVSGAAAQTLKSQNVEVIQGDLDDSASVAAAVKDAHTVVLITATVYDDKLYEREYNQGKTVADAAVAAGAKAIIFSSLVGVSQISNGKYKQAQHFDVKHDIEVYIRSLPGINKYFIVPGWFMQNFQVMSRPQHLGDGNYGFFNVMKPETEYPMIDVEGDIGKWVTAVLAEPEKYKGKTFAASTTTYTFRETAEILSKMSGKTVSYIQIPIDQFKQRLPKEMADDLAEMCQFIEEYGYYGPDSKMQVDWAAAQARGKLSTFEEYLANHPLNLA